MDQRGEEGERGAMGLGGGRGGGGGGGSRNEFAFKPYGGGGNIGLYFNWLSL